MKKLITSLLFSMCYLPQVSPPLEYPPAPPVVTMKPEIVPQPVMTPKPTVSGGGNQIWCSGPTAPGWNVSKEDGGCPCVPVTHFVVGNLIKGDGLAELYWGQGGEYVTIHQNNHSFKVKNVRFYQVKVETKNDWFYVTNQCSETDHIDP